MININSANKSELETLPGIGAAIAQKILEYREENNGFKTIDEIKNVNRIGDKTFEMIKNLISVN
jgi:competence protein ComEA